MTPKPCHYCNMFVTRDEEGRFYATSPSIKEPWECPANPSGHLIVAKPDVPEIRLPVPPRVHAKLKELAGSSSVENWARRVLTDAAEEASPSLRGSGLWSGDTSVWYSLVNPSDDEEN